MEPLKMLPWLARKAGIDDAHAQALWVEANRYAAARTGRINCPEHWKAAIDRLLDLLEEQRRIREALGMDRESPLTLALAAGGERL